MKAPLDPSEPLFPIRPNEPPCQYYLKHGTCKFGQACKFHHPPQSTHRVINGAGTVVMMNVGRQHDAPHLILNHSQSVGVQDAANQSMMVQFLPQRPDEPDCIYFLKNGRCKYGATCRFHHPLNYHQRRAEEQRRHHEQRRNQMSQHDRYPSAQIHYVQQPVGGISQGHVYVSDNHPIALVSVADREGTQSYQQVPVVTGPDGTQSYCLPMGSTVATDQGSSTTSVASSYDTSVSNVDHVGMHGEGSTFLLNRRNGSGSSLSTYGDSRGQSRLVLPHSASDGNIARRSRTLSHGSASDHPSMYEVGVSNTHRNGSGSWRMDRGPTSDQSTHVIHHSPHSIHRSQYGRVDPLDLSGGDSRSLSSQTRPPGITATASQPRRNSRRTNRAPRADEGFTMMTSALLNMLDTPQEVQGETGSEEEVLQGPFSHSDEAVDPSLLERLSLNSPRSNEGLRPPLNIGSSSDSARAMQLMPGRLGPSSPDNQDPNVGLYLP